MKTLPFFIAALLVFSIISRTSAQLNTSPSSNPSALANTIVGAGITVSNATLRCPTAASGTFSNGGSTNIGLQTGVILSSGAISNAIGPNNSPDISTNFNAAGDADLTAITGVTTNDACVLEFDFEAVANQISISYVFGSEEYREYVGSNFNDVFGFLVTGPNPAGGSYTNQNIATIPVNIPVAINSINHITNTAFYIDNPQGGGTTIQYDGFTVVLTASLAIIPCETYHFKLAIADGSDFILDSGVFLEEASFEASLQCQDVTLILEGDGTGSISAEELVASDLDACSFTFTVSQADFVCSDEGQNTVTVTADDGMGTVLTCDAIVTVVVPEGILNVDLGPHCRTIYSGYGPTECTDISADVSGGTGTYTYQWSTGDNTPSISICPDESVNVFVTVTDGNGCVEVGGPVEIIVVDVACGNNGNKVLVCHIPPGNPENAHTSCISPNAVAAHLAHGCFLGDCSETSDPCNTGNPFSIYQPDYIHLDEDGSEVLIWPNPGNDVIHIEVPEYTEGQVLISLISPEGRSISSVVLQEGLKRGSIQDLTKLAEGMYYILVSDQSGQIWSYKWLKNK